MGQKVWVAEVVVSPSLDEIRKAYFMRSSLPFTLQGVDGGESALVGVVEVEVRNIEEKQDFPRCVVLTGVVKQGITNRLFFWKRKRVFDLSITLQQDLTRLADVAFIEER